MIQKSFSSIRIQFQPKDSKIYFIKNTVWTFSTSFRLTYGFSKIRNYIRKAFFIVRKVVFSSSSPFFAIFCLNLHKRYVNPRRRFFNPFYMPKWRRRAEYDQNIFSSLALSVADVQDFQYFFRIPQSCWFVKNT